MFPLKSSPKTEYSTLHVWTNPGDAKKWTRRGSAVPIFPPAPKVKSHWLWEGESDGRSYLGINGRCQESPSCPGTVWVVITILVSWKPYFSSSPKPFAYIYIYIHIYSWTGLISRILGPKVETRWRLHRSAPGCPRLSPTTFQTRGRGTSNGKSSGFTWPNPEMDGSTIKNQGPALIFWRYPLVN